MGVTKAKRWTRTINATMLTHQEATASSHGPDKLGQDPVRLGEESLYFNVGDTIGGQDVFLGQGTIQFGNQSLLGQVEVLG